MWAGSPSISWVLVRYTHLQPLLELLLKGEAHVDRVSVLVEPQFRGEKMGFEASQREEEPLRLENLLTDLVRQTWGCPFHR